MLTDDIVAIRRLADLYSDAANRGDAAAMASVYAEEAVLTAYGETFHGRAAIEQGFEGMVERVEIVNQICSAGVFTVDGDRATARWTVTGFTKRRDSDKLQLFLGNYDDELVRTAAGWRFSRRILSRRAQMQLEGALRVWRT
ncbi:MAG: nuclear transport factor 2 family protein [Caulobacteraceae bacterium]|nr:nuclear transport factor 2 family protein [Caulobacteraceae bacterium]